MKIRAGHPLSAAAFGILLLVEFATIQAGPVNASEDDSLPQPIVELNEQFLALYQQGDFRDAIPVAKKLVTLSKQLLGHDNPDTAATLNNLARVYTEIGDYTDAEAPAKEALDILEKVLGRKDPATVTTISNLAYLYTLTGDYAKAEPLYTEAVEIDENLHGRKHPDTADVLYNLAGLYLRMGDYIKAEQLYNEVLEIREKFPEAGNLKIAQTKNNLASLYQTIGNYAKAKPLYEEALAICWNLGERDRSKVAPILDNFATLCIDMGDNDTAEWLSRKALEINKESFGEQSPETATSLNNLASALGKKGAIAEARSRYRQALEIVEKRFTRDNPFQVDVLNNLAFVETDLGQSEDARAHVRRASEIQHNLLGQILTFTSEQQRLSYLASFDPYSTLALVPDCQADLALAVLRYKGVVLDSMVDDRLLTKASTNPENHDRLEQLNIDRLELNRLLLQSADNVPERSKRIEQLEEEIERLEGQLARQISGFERTRAALSVTVAQVQACLPADAALIEYFLYWRYLGKSKFEPAYGALVLLPKGEPCWIPLDNAGKINKLVSRYSRLRRLNGSEADEGDVSKNLRWLYDAIWAPVSPHLSGDTKELIVSPDGQLNFISVATLLTPDDRFLGENYEVQYVASGRDLLQEQKQTAAREVVLFTAPDFDANLATHPAPKDAEAKMRGTETRGLQDLQFQKLEGFQNENEQLLRLFSAWHWPTQSHSGPNATKTALIEVRSPFILHLATHGFFESLGPSDTGSRALSKPSIFESKFFNNPMHQSGLALAGANVTLKLWNRGQEAPSDDGILTAEDAGTMDLQGTWLVTLAACDTAKGQERIGEGVMGLRRGFTKAGVKNLLMTLWEVADQTTTQIMTDFYQAAHKSGNVPQALAEVQRDWLVKLRNEKGLPDAVNLAGPFIMSSQGKP